MNKETTELIALAEKRNRSIPHLIEQEGVLQARREFRTTVIRILGAYFIRQGSTLAGQENLETALEIADRGNHLTVISNHFSDSDHAIRRIMLEEKGYRDFADRMLYLAGLKMIERPLVRQFTSGEKIVLVPTPSDMEKVKDVLKSYDLSREERAILQTLKRNYIELSQKARNDARRSLEENPGEVLALYPESTRSRARMIGQAHPLTNSWYFFLPGTFLVPIAVEGGEYMLPPGTAIPYKRIDAKVTVGKPVSAEKLRSKSLAVPNAQRARFLADYAFSFVVKLLDQRFVPENQRNYFRQLATE